jgi:putative ABC transport system permease protein
MAVGIVLGIFLHRYVIETVEIELVMFGRNIDWSSYVYSLLLTLFFSAFVNFVMFFKLRKINMVESLKSVE